MSNDFKIVAKTFFGFEPLLADELLKLGAKKIADEITSKTIGYEFLANINTSDILRWNIQNLAEKDK